MGHHLASRAEAALQAGAMRRFSSFSRQTVSCGTKCASTSALSTMVSEYNDRCISQIQNQYGPLREQS
eukprot:3820210-Rhodomonas_salina.2